ncbi:MAG: hypothetical protein P8R42_07765 [Candidatus Binatia bacterium]|nr:hypothetical protein [Candidatus Binatia bacterium]
MSAGDCSTALQRFTGPEADEVAVLCRPDHEQNPAEQARVAYRALAENLSGQGASFRDLSGETLFVRDAGRDLPLILEARSKVLGELGQAGDAPRPVVIGQAPLEAPAALELAASVVVPQDRDASSVQDLSVEPSCSCEGCALSGARLVRLGDQVSLHASNLYGLGADPAVQVKDMFRVAEQLLAHAGMGFHDVVRTWIHLRDIGRDYDALNAARREFFEDCGVEQRPASTGVQGIPFSGAHDFSLSLHAMKSPRPIDIQQMSTPSLNEAWSYGADFARGLRVVEVNKVVLHVSGTASIDAAGQTVHVGDLERQAERMLDNIESLLEGQGTTFGSLMSGVMYLKQPSDALAVRAICARRGFEGFPYAFVDAPLCRPELLCEAEVIAMLPLKPTGF